MKLTLESDEEIIRYLNGFKDMDVKHQKLERILKSVFPHLPKRAQKKIRGILEEESKK